MISQINFDENQAEICVLRIALPVKKEKKVKKRMGDGLVHNKGFPLRVSV